MFALKETKNDFSTLPRVDPRDVVDLMQQVRIPYSAVPFPDADSIIVIGGEYNELRGFKEADSIFTRHGILCAHTLGLEISSRPEIAAADLNQGHDYNDPKRSYYADLAFISYIPKEGIFDAGADCSTRQSPYGHDTITWQKRIHANRPKVVISFEGPLKRELTAWDICPPSYEKGPIFGAAIHDARENFYWDFAAHTIVRRDIAQKMGRPLEEAIKDYSPILYMANSLE